MSSSTFTWHVKLTKVFLQSVGNRHVYESSVDDSLFWGTWTDKQSSIPYHDVCDAGLDFVGFFSLRSDMSAIGCGDGIREEGLRDDYLELKFYTVLRA
ncbi:hypothetical protein TNCV_1845711 [Trichonephila clavipes]|nr:hypothetical protein TNCV_1845711 [Trichonephila clavipes]